MEIDEEVLERAQRVEQLYLNNITKDECLHLIL
jgi:hypothetical protein